MWPEGEKTIQLLAGVRNGDDAAMNTLLERHRLAVRRMVQMRMDQAIARRVDASDVVQDVMLEASTRLQNYLQNPGMPFHLWLRQLAKDRIIDMHRRHRVAQRRSVDREQQVFSIGDDEQSVADLATLLKDAELTPGATAIKNEFMNRFMIALNELSEEDRELIMMRHFEGLGNSEVAAALELSEAAAGMRHLRALKKLRSALGGDPQLSADA